MSLRDVIISGDWNLIGPDFNRYCEGYHAVEDTMVTDEMRRRKIMGYQGDYFGTPEVVEAIITRQKVLATESGTPLDIEVTWDGETLREVYSGSMVAPGEDPNEYTWKLNPETGYVHLPHWTWGPVDAEECDKVIGSPR